MIGIYKITNLLNEQSYIGLSVNIETAKNMKRLYIELLENMELKIFHLK